MIEIIKADNLDYMCLQESNSFDVIYNDILYATGRNFGDYKDLKFDRKIVLEHYAPRFLEMHRLLKETGILYIHLDMRISHWVRCLLDDIFGIENFLNNLVWIYSTQGYSKNNFSKKHDDILVYSRNIKKVKLNIEENRCEKPSENTIKRFLPEALANKGVYDYKSKKFIPIENEADFYKVFKGHPPYSWIDINVLPAASKERIEKYETQKPMALLEYLLKIAGFENCLVGDFYAGSFTTAEACAKLGFNFKGCDISEKAVNIGLQRISKYK